MSAASAPPAGSAPVLDGRALSRTFRRGNRSVTALRGVDLHLHAGEWLAVRGPSG